VEACHGSHSVERRVFTAGLFLTTHGELLPFSQRLASCALESFHFLFKPLLSDQGVRYSYKLVLVTLRPPPSSPSSYMDETCRVVFAVQDEERNGMRQCRSEGVTEEEQEREIGEAKAMHAFLYLLQTLLSSPFSALLSLCCSHLRYAIHEAYLCYRYLQQTQEKQGAKRKCLQSKGYGCWADGTVAGQTVLGTKSSSTACSNLLHSTLRREPDTQPSPQLPPFSVETISLTISH
jgi:hypothetical protein